MQAWKLLTHAGQYFLTSDIREQVYTHNIQRTEEKIPLKHTTEANSQSLRHCKVQESCHSSATMAEWAERCYPFLLKSRYCFPLCKKKKWFLRQETLQIPTH
jgi:hypothetical protein